MNVIRATPRELLIWLTVLFTVVFELLTVFARVYFNTSAAEWNARTNPPLLVQMHHMFWSVPFIVAALLVRKKKVPAACLWSLSLGLILSDLIHHFVVLPLWVGNTGWHWP